MLFPLFVCTHSNADHNGPGVIKDRLGNHVGMCADPRDADFIVESLNATWRHIGSDSRDFTGIEFANKINSNFSE